MSTVPKLLAYITRLSAFCINPEDGDRALFLLCDGKAVGCWVNNGKENGATLAAEVLKVSCPHVTVNGDGDYAAWWNEIKEARKIHPEEMKKFDIQ